MKRETSVYSPIGASNHAKTKRAEHDFYSTPEIAVTLLLDELGNDLSDNILEPACGDGAISKVLEEHGYNVLSMDLFERGYGISGVDFLKHDEPFAGDIVTNPPFRLAQEFIEHGLQIINDGNKVCVLLRLVFLEGQRRRSLFDRKMLKTVYVFSKRISCYLSGEYKNYASAVAFAWFVFEKGYNGNPEIRWIN